MKIFFIINGGRAPVAAGLVERLEAILKESGHGYRLEISRTLDEAYGFVDEAAGGDFDTLWMGGGDGTIHVLMNRALTTGLHLGVVPMGTVNALARALGIPMQPEAAARHLLTAAPKPMNIGCVNGERRFLCFAGVGFDAAVVHDVGGAFKRLGGRLAYAAAGAASVLALRRIVPYALEFGEGARRAGLKGEGSETVTNDTGYSFVLSNIRNYAGFNLFPDAHPTADAMEMWNFRKRRVDAMALWTAASMVGWKRWQRHMKRNVGHYLVRCFTVTSHRPMYLQLDGEAVTLGDGTRYEFEFCSEAVSVLM